jgi:hypothetical protein
MFCHSFLSLRPDTPIDSIGGVFLVLGRKAPVPKYTLLDVLVVCVDLAADFCQFSCATVWEAN